MKRVLQSSTDSRRSSVRARRLDQLKTLYSNVIAKSFRFTTTNEKQLSVMECMGESRLAFLVPHLLLYV